MDTAKQLKSTRKIPQLETSSDYNSASTEVVYISNPSSFNDLPSDQLVSMGSASLYLDGRAEQEAKILQRALPPRPSAIPYKQGPQSTSRAVPRSSNRESFTSIERARDVASIALAPVRPSKVSKAGKKGKSQPRAISSISCGAAQYQAPLSRRIQTGCQDMYPISDDTLPMTSSRRSQRILEQRATTRRRSLRLSERYRTSGTSATLAKPSGISKISSKKATPKRIKSKEDCPEFTSHVP